MITVTERAATELQELLATSNAPPGQGIKLVPSLVFRTCKMHGGGYELSPQDLDDLVCARSAAPKMWAHVRKTSLAVPAASA